MAAVVQTIVNGYHSVFTDLRDPRVDGWFLMDSPLPTLTLCLGYVFIVKFLGPKFMKDRPAYEFRNILIAYNAIQVVFSMWLFYEFGMGGWFRGYSYKCQPVDYSKNEMAIRMVHASWWYYFSKFTEFFDTFFFVLRKKDQHISTLHVIHHGVMPMSVWFGVKFTPGGHSTFFGLLNSFVHVIMYFYYMLTAMGPQYAKYLWWKKHVTTLQMVQFVAIFSHSFQLAFVQCEYPKAFMWWIGGHAVLFFFLFAEFYRKAYQNWKPGHRSILSSLMPCIVQEHLKGGNPLANGHTVVSNGHANGKANGHANGYANGKANGHSNGVANGEANGQISSMSNGKANGYKSHKED